MSKLPVFLRVIRGGKAIEMKQVSGDQIIIGRGGDVTLVVNDPKTASIHAMIENRNGKYILCDLGTEFGTYIGGKKIVEQEITTGSQFVIGETTIEFHVGIPKISSPQPAPVKSMPAAPSPIKPIPKAPNQVAPKPNPIPPPVKPKSSSTSSGFGGMMAMPAPTGKPIVRPPAKGTFAPPSSSRAKESLKPGKGNVLEIVVLWKDRVLMEHHFSTVKVVTVGSHPKNDIILPIFGSVRLSHPLIKIDTSSTTLILTSDMTGEVVKKDLNRINFSELKAARQMQTSGTNYLYSLKQEEMVKVNFGEGVELVIRYVPSSGVPKAAPILDISVNQLTWLLVSLLGAVLFLFYVFLYAPIPQEEKQEESIVPRKAQFIYKRPVEEIKPVEVAPVPKTAQENIKDKEVAPARGEEGAAKEAKPNKSKSTKQILTADKPGKDKGIQKPAPNPNKDTGAKAKSKDVTKSGVLGAFATKGVQEQLNKAYKGSGNVTGAAQSATGSGTEAAGAGINPGAGLKEVGMGGNGTATVGIAGPQTKGKGGGLSGYGTGPLGAKKNATIIAGNDEATVSGGIDKEAIRRVVLANIRQIKACYEKGLNRDPSLYGKITIQWNIGAGGYVTEAGIKHTTMNSPEVEKCAVSRLKTWKFPEPPTNEVAVVSYPFVFQAQE